MKKGDLRYSPERPNRLGWFPMSAVNLSILLLLGMPFLGAHAEKTPPPEAPKQDVVEQKKEQPSLLDLAKQERDRRAHSDESAPVLRNEDLGRLKSARVVTSQAPRGAKPVPDQETSEEVTEPASAADEAAAAEALDLDYWRAAFDEAKVGLQDAISRRMVLELRMNNLRNAYLQTADGTTRERIESELNQTYLEVGQAREDEKASMQVVQELERQASKAGLTPGQIRDLVGQLPESKSIFDGVPEAQISPES